MSHYRVLEKLVSGGMGVVYKAEDTPTIRLVSVNLQVEHKQFIGMCTYSALRLGEPHTSSP